MKFTNDIIFVTAYKDICRGEWNVFRRSTKEYIDLFLKLAFNIKYTLVVYIENDILEKMNIYDFPSNIIFKDLSKVNTFYNKYLEIDTSILESVEYKNKIPENRKNNPEHCSKGYNPINNSKICFVKDTKLNHSGYKFYCWLDFGTSNYDILDHPTNLNIDIIKEKITYSCFDIPSKRIEPNIMLKTNKIYFTGTPIIIYSDYVEILYDLWEKKLKDFYSNKITDDDQNVILQIYFDNPELFDIKYTTKWCSLFRENFNSN